MCNILFEAISLSMTSLSGVIYFDYLETNDIQEDFEKSLQPKVFFTLNFLFSSWKISKNT